MDKNTERKAYEWRLRNLENKPRFDGNGVRIEMRMTFDEWLSVWVKSKKLHLRGSRKGQYCMSRYNDLGHYEVGNVFIQLSSDNVRQAHLGSKRTEETCQNISKSLEGKRDGELNGFFGKRHTQEAIERMSKSHQGQVVTPEQRAKLSVAAQKIVTCPHCGFTGNGPAMRRWHFDNCRHI